MPNFFPCCWHLKSFRLFHSALKPPLFRLTKLDHRTDYSPCSMFEMTSYQSPTKWCSSSRAPFEPIEKRKMKFRWISSNSRGLSSKSSCILHSNRRYFKGGLLICFVGHMKRASIKLQNDKSAGLWMVKACSCWLCFRCYLGHLMLTFDTY